MAKLWESFEVEKNEHQSDGVRMPTADGSEDAICNPALFEQSSEVGEKRGISVVLVSPPVTPNTNLNSFHNLGPE